MGHNYDRVTIDLPGKTTEWHLPRRNSSVPIRVQQYEIVSSSQATYINSKSLFRHFFSLRKQTEMATEENYYTWLCGAESGIRG
jgi:hypothetical protein